MNNYFRITGYYLAKDIGFIADSYGLYKEVWEFSSFLVKNGVKIIAVGDDNKFVDGNIGRAEPDTEHIILRACSKGKPEIINGIIEINGKNYTPNKTA